MFEKIIDIINSYLWSLPMIILLFGTHIFLTFSLKFPQRKLLTAIKLSFTSDKDAKGDVSQAKALVTSLAATIGTGNIIGVGTAIALGGPGAVFWCWLAGIFGIATKYSESLLAVKFRRKSSTGEMLGGPMIALENGLGMKWLAVLFAIFTALATFGIGNTVQSNAITTILYEGVGVSPYLSSAIITILVALVIMYGIKGITKVCSILVPFMVLIYVIGCIIILYINSEFLGEAISLIFTEAFKLEAIGGGAVGGGILMAARYGIARGLFSNEAGMGSAPILSAAAKTNNPVRQALVSSTATFWDTVVVCALTGIVLVSSIIANPEIDYSDGALLTKLAFEKIPYIGNFILTIAICTFCFSTIIGWYVYGEKAIEYLGGGRKFIKVYRWINIIVCYIGGIIQLTLVWSLADMMNALMAIPNLISLLLLHKIIVKETNHYLWQGNLNKINSED